MIEDRNTTNHSRFNGFYYIQKNNIKWNVTAFKMSGKLSQGSSGKLAPQGKISAKEGGVNEGLIADDGTELAIYAVRQHKNIIQIPIHTNERFDTPRFGRILDSNLRILNALYRAF